MIDHGGFATISLSFRMYVIYHITTTTRVLQLTQFMLFMTRQKNQPKLHTELKNDLLKVSAFNYKWNTVLDVCACVTGLHEHVS